MRLPIVDPAPASARRTTVRPNGHHPSAAASGVHAVTVVRKPWATETKVTWW